MAKKIDVNGFWTIKENPVTKEGVFQYSGAQIDFDGSLGLDQGKLYNVYRPADELHKDETIESFNGIPFIDEHEMIGDGCTQYDQRPAGGVLFNVRPSGGATVGDFKIFSEDLKDSIQAGKKELSLGYRCRYEKSMGVFNGKTYDFIQRGIVGNHIALVDKGRMGSDVRVYDSKATVFDAIEEIKPMSKTLKERLIAAMDGCDFSDEEKKQVEDAFEELTDEQKAEKAKAEDEESKKAEEEEKAKAADEEAKKADEEEKAKAADEEAKKKADEEEKNKPSAMDAFPAFAQMIADRDALAKQVTPLIGTFDHAPMTDEQVAVYACKKLKLQVAKDEALATLKGYLLGKKQSVAPVAMDSAASTKKDTAIERYLKGDK